MPTVAVISASLALLLVLPFLASAFVCTHRSVHSLTKCLLLMLEVIKLVYEKPIYENRSGQFILLRAHLGGSAGEGGVSGR